MRKDYYTTGELARICSVSPATIFRAIINKSLLARTTPGGHYRISKEVAEEFLKKNNIPIPRKDTKSARILIAEDNPAELRMFKRALEKINGFEIKTTTSGYEAGFLTRSFKPDLVLLDIFLADMNGKEVAKLIRSDPELKHTKIVVITGSRDPKVRQEIKASKYDAVIWKPVTPKKLQEAIHSQLK